MPNKEEPMAHLSLMKARKLADLLNSAGDVYVRILTTNQLAIGKDPMNHDAVIDLSKEAILPANGKAPAPEPPPQPEPKTRQSRSTGRYLIEFKGKMIECRSLREMLAEGLKAIEAHKPGTLEKLSTIKPRSKRIVAADKNKLFEDAELVEKYSERLMTGWWYGTNNSADETKTWLKRACELAGLTWGKDFEVDL